MIEKQDGRKVDRQTLEHIRINSIERWLDGESPVDVIRNTGFCETTIYKWINLYFEGGMDALLSTKAPGANPKLNQEQQEELGTIIVGHDPRAYGRDSGLWTRQIVADLIQEKFSITMGLTSVGELLSKLNISPQKPIRRAYEQDPDAVEKWREEDYPAIENRALANGAEVIFWDESGYRLDDQVGRTWGKRGKTPAVDATGKRGRTNTAIAISPKGAFWFEEFDGNLNSERFCELLDRFMKTRRKPVILIMDRHPTHVSKATTEHIESYGAKLSKELLPGYSPELNPVEYVNHYAKKVGPRKRLPKDKKNLSEIITQTLAPLKGAFNKIKKFFDHPELKYING